MTNTPFSDEVYHGYASAIRPFLQANGKVSQAVDDADLRQLTWLVNLSTSQLEVLSDLARQAILGIVVNGGLRDSADIAPVATIRSAFDRGNEALLGVGPPYDDMIAEHYPRTMVEGLGEQIDAALAGDEPNLGQLMTPLDVSPDSGYMGLREDLVEALNTRADELNAAAAARERLYIALAAATLAATLLLTWVVSRSITRPLRSLTRQAKALADRRLPEAVLGILDTPLGEDIAVPHTRAVRVDTRDEVADVADALNTVQDTALDLAVEQAVLRRNIADSFVNLGRRNQNLLGRQLDFITELEGRETDADALSNLFRLDHLATRMRRNAESLLVLAGFEPPRQWAAPVRLTDVIRAALGEVENYRRVRVDGVEPATILGSAAADLAHLLAELVENALAFSPPDQTVLVRGRREDGGGYTLAVIDTGLGMNTGDLAAANRRLAGVESFTVAPSKYLGHYVAGNLAARHGIRTRLRASRGTGITAVVELPSTMLTTDAAPAAPAAPVARASAGPRTDGVPAAPLLGRAPVRGEAGAGRPPRPPTPGPAGPAGGSRPSPEPMPGARPARPMPEPAPPAPARPSPEGIPAPTLARRVKGAQPPRTGVVPLRGRDTGPASAASGAAPQRGAELRDLLASFTAGVQRGLAESGPHRVHASPR